jgi:predicted membrane protein
MIIIQYKRVKMADELIYAGVNLTEVSQALGVSPIIVSIFFAIIIFWVVFWKGLALWKAANKKSIYWFVILLVLNGITLGILEILYIFVFSKINLKRKPNRKQKASSKKKKK